MRKADKVNPDLILSDRITDTYEVVKVMSELRLAQKLKKEMLAKFGRQNTVLTTWYRSWVWVIEDEGIEVMVSSSVRGTIYQSLCRDTGKLINFLYKFHQFIQA